MRLHKITLNVEKGNKNFGENQKKTTQVECPPKVS